MKQRLLSDLLPTIIAADLSGSNHVRLPLVSDHPTLQVAVRSIVGTGERGRQQGVVETVGVTPGHGGRLDDRILREEERARMKK